jgi:hypothetical protein
MVAGQVDTIGGDVIITIDGVRIRNLDDLSTFLEDHTLLGQTIEVTIVRDDEPRSLSLMLGNELNLLRFKMSETWDKPNHYLGNHLLLLLG